MKPINIGLPAIHTKINGVFRKNLLPSVQIQSPKFKMISNSPLAKGLSIKRRKSIERLDSRITINTRSRVSGLVRVERKKRIELKIFSAYRACYPIFKLIYYAAANAKHNMGLNEEYLVITKATVNEGTTVKKLKPRAQGRSYPIKRPTCHITIVLKDTSLYKKYVVENSIRCLKKTDSPHLLLKSFLIFACT